MWVTGGLGSAWLPTQRRLHELSKRCVVALLSD